MFDLTQLIKEPTRVTKTTSSILDLILVSDQNKISHSGVSCIGVSDHQLTFCTRKIKKNPVNKHNGVKLRSLKNYTKENFENKLEQVNWNEVTVCDNVDTAWSIFKTKLLSVIDEIAPVKNVRIKQNTNPWMTDEIIQLIQERNTALKKFRKTKENTWYDTYLYLRNQVQYKKTKAKSDYFTNQINEHKNHPKKLWKTLNSMGTSSTSGTKAQNIGIQVNNEIVFDKPTVANVFNDFFSTIATRLVDQLPGQLGKYGFAHLVSYYQNFNVSKDCFCLCGVTEDKVSKILSNLNSNKATGLDQLPSRFIKDGAKFITTPLTFIVNLSISSSRIPDDLKAAKITPIYKKNSKTEAGNYRPVSILSIISKVFEKAVYEQVDHYLSDNKLLYEYQSGFRTSYSTDTCLIHLTDYIKQEQDKGNYTGMVLIDLQKAFDTVDHKILLQKLEALGFQKTTIEWFESYLNGRLQCVDIGGTLSTPAIVTCGVPQGSILGPLLFLIYVNDMPSAVSCKLLLYADDSALLVSGKDPADIQQRLSSELQSIREWLIDNKLSLHLGKTESILFGSKQRLKQHDSISVTCAGNTIGSKSCVKYIGIDLDQSLSGDHIVDKVVNKSNAKIKFLYRQARNVNLETKKLLTSALIQCHYDYAASSWYSGLTKRNKRRLQISQNKLIRFLLNAPPRTHIGPTEFRQVNMLPVDLRVTQLKLNHVYNIINNSAPNYLTSSFTLRTSLHNNNHNTRSGSLSLVIPSVKSFGGTSFFYTGAKLWNDVPIQTQSSTTKPTFKRSLKAHLFHWLEQQDQNPCIFF